MLGLRIARTAVSQIPSPLLGVVYRQQTKHCHQKGICRVQHICADRMASSEANDEELKLAIAMSLADAKPLAFSPGNAQSSDITAPAQTEQWLKPSQGPVGLDLAALARERHARQARRKRERSISPPPVGRKRAHVETTTIEMPSGARLNMFSTLVKQDQAGRKSEVANVANEKLRAASPAVKVEGEPWAGSVLPTQGELAYPGGVVKKTWAFGHPRSGNDIKLEEVLEAPTLRTAVISAFQWDTDWLLSKLKIPPNGGSTKCIFVMQAKDEAFRQQMLKETEDMRSFLRLCFPPMEGQTFCMHSKLMLLFHPEKLRIAIPTANLLNFDWGETGVMENSCFIIDLPRLPKDTEVETDNGTRFREELIYFLEKQGLDDDVRDGVLRFDFGATANMAFVHNVGGISLDDEAERTGLPGLGRAVRDLSLQTNDLEIEFCASSIGSLNDDYLRATHSAAKGVDIIAASAAASATAKADFFKPGAKKAATENIRDKMRIYFPTHETVTSSTAGAAGTICISRKYWENIPFPRSVFRDYTSTRQGLLSHNKILYARGKRSNGDDVAWAYVGSANMSESAWGKLVYDKKTRAWKINCRNWECGVLLPVPAEKLGIKKLEKATNRIKKEKIEGEDLETESEDDGGARPLSASPFVSMDVFQGLVDPPFVFPGAEYNGREPWYFQER